jgi:hypothetical protein
LQRKDRALVLEQQIQSHARSVWSRSEAPPVKVRIAYNGWTIVRHSISGITR